MYWEGLQHDRPKAAESMFRLSKEPVVVADKNAAFDLIARCLELAPCGRPQSMDEVLRHRFFSGSRVQGVDVTQSVVDTINRGEIHIEEVDLDGLVQGVVSRGLLSASLSVEAADVFVIAVPTPFDKDHQPDISYVLAAARSIAPVLKTGDCVILESTSPVGTTEAIRDLIAERAFGLPDRVAIGRLPANHDVCPLDCCPAPLRPAGPPAAAGRPH